MLATLDNVSRVECCTRTNQGSSSVPPVDCPSCLRSCPAPLTVCASAVAAVSSARPAASAATVLHPERSALVWPVHWL